MSADIEKMTFEAALQELKNIFEQMEAANLPLEEAVSAYERSMLLKKHCEKKLRDAEVRVSKVTQTQPMTTEPFDVNASTEG